MPEFRFGVVRHTMLDVVVEADTVEAAAGQLGSWMNGHTAAPVAELDDNFTVLAVYRKDGEEFSKLDASFSVRCATYSNSFCPIESRLPHRFREATTSALVTG